MISFGNSVAYLRKPSFFLTLKVSFIRLIEIFLVGFVSLPCQAFEFCESFSYSRSEMCIS